MSAKCIKVNALQRFGMLSSTSTIYEVHFRTLRVRETAPFRQQQKNKKTSNPYLYHPISPLQLANYFEGILRPEAGCNAAPQQTVITARVYCNVLYERDVGHETHLSFIGVFCDSSKSLISTTPPFRF